MLQDSIDLLEMQGLFANEKYYTDMINLTSQQIKRLQEEKTGLQRMLSSMPSDTIGSESYNAMYQEILGIDEEISQLTNDTVEFNNTLRNLNWETFEYLEDSIKRITEETDYVIELMSKKDLFDENGNKTDYATATLGLHAANYDVYKQLAQDYYEEVQELEKQLVDGAGQDVLEQYNNMADAHREMILAAEDEKQAILDLIEDGYNAQFDALQKLIDKKKEQLNLEKNLYDYQKNVKEQTDNIASLEKQKISLVDDDSEDTMAKIQQIKVQLEEAKENLKETEYEKYLSDTETMLDQLATDYETWMNERLDNEDALLEEIIGQVSTQGEAIKDTLESIAAEYGTKISDTLTTVFSADQPFTTALTSGLSGIKDNLTNGLSGITTAINNLVSKIANITNIQDKGNAGTDNVSSTPTTNVPKPNPPSKPITPSNPQTNTSNGNTSNSNNSSSNFFEPKKDYYDKSKLNVNSSIVDKLKSCDFDSSFAARSRYWSKMGFGGTYTASYAQNVKMLNWMKSHGYKRGTNNVPYSGIFATQEDGEEIVLRNGQPLTLTKLLSGDKVLNAKASENFYKLMNNPELMESLNRAVIPQLNINTKLPEFVNRNANGMTAKVDIGDISISLPNVTNYKEFRNELVKDSSFEKSMLTMVNNAVSGKSTLSKTKYI